MPAVAFSAASAPTLTMPTGRRCFERGEGCPYGVDSGLHVYPKQEVEIRRVAVFDLDPAKPARDVQEGVDAPEVRHHRLHCANRSCFVSEIDSAEQERLRPQPLRKAGRVLSPVSQHSDVESMLKCSGGYHLA
jgi:hypothetical protein